MYVKISNEWDGYRDGLEFGGCRSELYFGKGTFEFILQWRNAYGTHTGQGHPAVVYTSYSRGSGEEKGKAICHREIWIGKVRLYLEYATSKRPYGEKIECVYRAFTRKGTFTRIILNKPYRG